ncbi:MAG: 1-acyl-sn-glycerol-3-phosphate acyltransferase [Bacteroidales bacterium]|nr:1-acyl-sn-glycerol-3-phosphate acyltransferase [Bacteroidales bacterium]
MIDFGRIAKPNLLYRLLYGYVSLAVRFIYYRKFQVIGRDNIPKDKKEGFLLICNHQNGLVDALSIIFAVVPREPVFLARGDIFKKDSIARLLRFLRIMPAFRQRDVGIEGLGQNEAIFEQTVRLMQEGVVVAIFPEAGHQDHHYLGSFKKGFARMAFGYEEACSFSKDLKILPLGHHYLGYTGMQNDALFTIGEPFTFEELYDTYREHPERGLHLLALKARERVNSMILDIEDPDNYPAVEMLCQMYVPIYEKRHGLRRSHLENDLKARRAVNERLKEAGYGKPAEPYASSDSESASTKTSLAADLISKAGEYLSNLKKLKMDDYVVERASTLGFIGRTLLWILLLPVFALTALINFIPHHISKGIARKIKDKMLFPSLQMGVGFFAFLIWYLILFAVIWIVGKKFWIALVALPLLPITMLAYHHLRELTKRLQFRLRKYLLKLRRDPLMNATQHLRRDIMSGLNKLMA